MDKGYIHQLTWLRGLAAFFVVVSHCVRATEVTYTGTDEVSRVWLFLLFDLGSFGVVLFFALSGCTLYISNQNKVKLDDVYGFYIKRFFRIWPAFAVSLLIYLLFQPVFASYYGEPQGHWIEGQFLDQYSTFDVIKYLTLTFNITGPSGLFNNAYWSLPVEFQYYLFFPLIIFSLRKIGVIGPIIIAAVLFLLPKLGIIEFDRNIFFTLAFSFCGGVLVGYIYETKRPSVGVLFAGSCLIVATLISSAIGNKLFNLPAVPILNDKWVWWGVLALASVYFVLVAKFSIPDSLRKFLEDYGTVSYSTYLYHNLVIGFAVILMIEFGIDHGMARILFCFTLAFFLSYLLAKLSYNYVEKTSITIGHKLASKKR